MPVDEKVEPQASKSGGKSPAPRKTFAKEVEAKYPERSDSKRKVHFLFRNGTTEFFRVNYFQYTGDFVESHWIEVKDGVVSMCPEENSTVKLTTK